MTEPSVESPRINKVALAAVIMTGIVILACIVALAAISIAFFLNAPW